MSFADGAALVRETLALNLRPPRQRRVSQWADEVRIVPPDSGSPEPGPWRNALTPYLVEPMDCCGPDDPSYEIAVMGSAQTGKSSIGENFIGHAITDAPASTLIVLPSLEEAKKYNRVKLGPMIQAAPAIRMQVKDQKSRDETGSTSAFKKLVGGAYIVVTGANSSAGLQMISVKNLLGEEITEYQDDLDGRGDPWEMAKARQKAWQQRGAKRLAVSTPGIKGACRISAMYEAGDQRRYYLPCPGCGCYFVPRFSDLKHHAETAPYGSYLRCPANGCVIEHWQKSAMVARGVWLKTYPGEDAPGDYATVEELEGFRARPSRGRQPSFHFWQVISPFVDWEQIHAEYFNSRGNHLLEKVFAQQGLGEAFEEKGEAPDDEKLFLRSIDGHKLGSIPAGGLVLTGMVDVQANRLEWAVWAWGPGMTSWLVDKGIIKGDPDDETTWKTLDGTVLGRTYRMPRGRAFPVELWGVDSGFKSHAVYAFSRGRPRVLATDGKFGHLLPIVGTPKKVDVNWKGKPIKGGAMLYPIGTYPLKSLLYSGLRKTIDGPDKDGAWPIGAVILSSDIDREYCQQLTAEYLADEATRDGRVRKIWKKKKGSPNEALDIWVGARAMAFQLGLDRYTPEQWRALALEREAPPDDPQGDLLAMTEIAATVMSPPAHEDSPAGAIAESERTEPTRDERPERAPWIERKTNWMRRN